MTVEIQLKTLSQHGLVNLADAALPGRARIRHQNVDAAEPFDNLVERRCDGRRVGDVAGERGCATADASGGFLCGFNIDVEQCDGRAGRGERARRCRADGAGRTGDAAICPASGFSGSLPSFACSSDQYSQSNMSASEIDSNLPMASASVIAATADSATSAATAASFLLRPSPNSPTPGTSTTRGATIEHALHAADARVVALEIGVDSFRRTQRRRLRPSRLKSVRLAVFRRRDEQGPVLGADGVVRRDDALLAVARSSAPFTKCRISGVARNSSDKPADTRLRLSSAGHRHRAGSGQSLKRAAICCGSCTRHEHGLAVARDVRFGERDHLDHALVGFARGTRRT